MLIKSGDDRTNDIEVLRGLLNHPAANADVKRKLEQEIRFIQSGVKGERDAAYEIAFHYGQTKNWAVIHDLRIEHRGRVAQIDHILINRFLDVWVCESKRFSEGIAINEHGECSAFFGGKSHGVPSPFEQNRKHCGVLQDVFDDRAVELPKRLGFAIKPNVQSLVLVSKNAFIERTKAKIEGIDEILKVDQIKARIDKALDGDNNPMVLAKVVSSDTLTQFAHRLAELHVPASFDWHARFGLPKGATAVVTSTAAAESISEPQAETEPRKSKLACHACGTVVSYKVAKFCWFNKTRFGGDVYCMECQKNVPQHG